MLLDVFDASVAASLPSFQLDVEAVRQGPFATRRLFEGSVVQCGICRSDETSWMLEFEMILLYIVFFFHI